MRDVKKILCLILLLVFGPAYNCFAARNCDEQVRFSATFKWMEGEVSMITSNIDRQIDNDTEIYNAAKARIDVLAGMFTKPLSQERRLEGCNNYETCEAGKTLQECSPALCRCFAEIIAQDEYIANLQNKLCNSGINLNDQHANLREFIASYTPLRLQTSSGGDSGGETYVTGEIEHAPVVQSSEETGVLRNTIASQTISMSVGTSFLYETRDLKAINTQMKDWDRACERVSKPDRADTTGPQNTQESGKIKHTCVIKTCRGRGYAPSADGQSCVLSESGSSSAPASSSGSTSGGGGTSYQQIRDFVDESARNISVGSSITVKSDIIRGSAGVREHVNMWDDACTNLRNKPDRAATTGPEITTEGDNTRHFCVIKTCRGRGYEPAAGGTTCALNESSDATTPASSSGGETLMSGSVDEAPVVNTSSQPVDLRNTIANQAHSMTLGMSFVYSASDMKRINTHMNDWNRACERVSKPQHADTTGFKNVPEGGKTKHICVIKTCKNQYTPADDGLSCIKQNRSSGGGSTPDPASTNPVPASTPAPATPAGTEATAGGETDKNQTIDRLPSKPAPLIQTGPAEPEKLVYIGGSLTFTDEELRNAAFSESVNNWERKCNSYPEDSDDVTINATYVKKDKKRKQNTWTCLIQSCNEDVAGLPQTPSPDGKSCISQDGSSCTAGDRHADRTRYDARQGVCIIETCKEDYTLVDGKCEKTKKLERQQARATTRLEKDFVSDINKLSDAFEKVVKKITKECEKSGGTINNGVCENAPAPATDQQAKAPTNRRGSGRR